MTSEEKRDLLKEEYFLRQSHISDFDKRALSIKAWSIIASLAAAGAAFIRDAPALLILSALSSLVFC